jgi:hypothetical protein
LNKAEGEKIGHLFPRQWIEMFRAVIEPIWINRVAETIRRLMQWKEFFFSLIIDQEMTLQSVNITHTVFQEYVFPVNLFHQWQGELSCCVVLESEEIAKWKFTQHVKLEGASISLRLGNEVDGWTFLSGRSDQRFPTLEISRTLQGAYVGETFESTGVICQQEWSQSDFTMAERADN